jgi:glucose/arabinose dehydrogenase
VFDGLPQPTDFAFAPDGRIFVATKGGAVRIIKDGALLPQPFIEVPANNFHERGLLGLALDPQFSTNGFAYLYYDEDADFYAEQSTGRVSRLLRVTAAGDRALQGSEAVILGSQGGDEAHPSCQDLPIEADCLATDGISHMGGALRFASDGTLFMATGDGAYFTANPEVLTVRAQNLDSLAGKVLRINPDGTAPADNPFYTGDPTANRSKVWAYGFRNPFRFGLQPGADLPFVGDVGSALWEEIDVATPGTNFGWPCYEGAAPNEVHASFAFCQTFLTSGAVVAAPLYAYPPENLVGSAIIAGVFVSGANYPPELQGAFVFGDWVHHSISILKVDANNQLIADSARELIPNAGSPVDFEAGPDGDVYYLTFEAENGLGALRRIVYRGG